MSTLVSPASIDLYDRAAAVTPGSVNSCRRKIDPPICFRRGEGGYVEDVDGRRYIDYHAAYGAILHGHSHPPVLERVRDALDGGVLFGVGTTEIEYQLAAKLVGHIPSMEQALLCNTGSEATLNLIRLSRAVTGRQRIIKFQGCYHGFHDYVLRNNQSPAERLGKRDPGSAGMLEEAIDATLVCRFNDLDDVEATLRAYPGEIASVVVEPVAHNAPAIVGTDAFLSGLRALCDREGVLLIFDEIVTGFRHHIVTTTDRARPRRLFPGRATALNPRGDRHSGVPAYGFLRRGSSAAAVCHDRDGQQPRASARLRGRPAALRGQRRSASARRVDYARRREFNRVGGRRWPWLAPQTVGSSLGPRRERRRARRVQNRRQVVAGRWLSECRRRRGAERTPQVGIDVELRHAEADRGPQITGRQA